MTNNMGEALKKWLKSNKELNPREEALLNLKVSSSFAGEGLEKLCDEYGITGTQYNVLRILKGVYPEGHPRCEIITRMLERAPDITRLIDRLEKQSLVERDRNSEDRRHSITKITKKGLSIVNAIQKEAGKQIDEVTKNLSDEECKLLSSLCEKIYENKI